MAAIGTDIDFAKNLLIKGELVAIPTETVYGLAGNAFNPGAVTKIFQVKNRPEFDPLITHTNDLAKVKKYVKNIPEQAKQLAEAFWPGPLTLLLAKDDHIPDIVTSGLATVAVRIPNHPLTLELLGNLDFPVAAPSANPFGYISPTTASHVADQLGAKISYILDGGPCKIGIESTIIGFEDSKPVVYRLGGMSVEEIEKIAGKVSIKPHSSSNPLAPGMLKSHYAPKNNLIIGDINVLLSQFDIKDIAILSLKDSYPGLESDRQIILSRAGDLNEAAKNLFSAMRYLDTLPVQFILTELMPDRGLGRAINDRLQRAAAK
ncbi:L-threonylcarbamoyladenylate synthase [soil metagenome]